MLALEVEYLTGRVVSSCHDDRRKVEWPPHPARLFAALVAAYKECDLNETVGRALEWLEAQPVPSIYANPPQHQGLVRDVCDVFVPVNDPKKNDLRLLPEKRSRQPRWFPSFTPEDSTVYFIWNEAQLDEQTRNALQKAAENVTYLGHSMSPVRVLVRQDIPKNILPNLTPDQSGQLLFRTSGQGRLEYLETEHQRRLINASLQPRLGRVTEYRVEGNMIVTPPRSYYQRIYILRKTQGCRLSLDSAYGLCSIIRKALLDLCDDPLPETISGHLPDGAVSHQPHMAVIPLGNVGNRHADGHIMGFAVLFPEHAESSERKHLEAGLRDLHQITLGFLGEWQIELLNAENIEAAAKTLQPETYAKAHQHWATVTPLVFGHFPKNKPGKDALAIISQSCLDIGLPEPIEVEILPGSRFIGAPLAKEFKTNRDFQKTSHHKDKLIAHIRLSFAEPVHGPILLGAGRFLGMGLCRPDFKREKDYA